MPTEILRLGPPAQFNNLTLVTFPGLVRTAIGFLIAGAALIFFMMLLLGGIKWISAGGDKGQLEQAKTQISNALTGLLVVFIVWAVLSLVGILFGVDLFNLQIPRTFVG